MHSFDLKLVYTNTHVVQVLLDIDFSQCCLYQFYLVSSEIKVKSVPLQFCVCLTFVFYCSHLKICESNSAGSVDG